MRRAMKILYPALAAGALAFAGCEDRGTFEDAGEEVDEVIEDAGDAIEDAGDEIEDATHPDWKGGS